MSRKSEREPWKQRALRLTRSDRKSIEEKLLPAEVAFPTLGRQTSGEQEACKRRTGLFLILDCFSDILLGYSATNSIITVPSVTPDYQHPSRGDFFISLHFQNRLRDIPGAARKATGARP